MPWVDFPTRIPAYLCEPQQLFPIVYALEKPRLNKLAVLLDWPDRFSRRAPLTGPSQAIKYMHMLTKNLALPLMIGLVLLSGHALAEPAPNIVMILADDMGFSDLGSYGGEIHTPNIDQLATQGIRFTSFYNTARCSTTRASLLSGRYPHNVQMGHLAGNRFSDIDGYHGHLDESIPILPEWLKAHHYKNYMSGKWHLANWSPNEIPNGSIENLGNTPLKRGFDRFYGTLLGGNNYFEPKYFYRGNEPILSLDADFYYTDALSLEAVKHINTHQAIYPHQPFFLYLAYTAPHWPLQAPAETIKKYRQAYSSGWGSLRKERLARLKAATIVPDTTILATIDAGTPVWSEVNNKDWFIEKMAVHAAMVEHIDHGVGQIINALRAHGELDNTLILVMSDNGASAENLFEIPNWSSFLMSPRFDSFIGKYQPSGGQAYDLMSGKELMPGPKHHFQMLGPEWAQASNTPFKKYKTWVHEGGISSPLIVHWPKGLKEQSGTLINYPAHVIDIMPTIISIVADKANLEQDGVNLLPALQGGTLPKRQLFFEHEGYRAVRGTKWKLVAAQGGPWELYDIEVDRTERNDLATQYPDCVSRMKADYARYARDNKVKDWSVITKPL